MTKKIDLTGKKFGRLLVIRESIEKTNKISWECLCDCGNPKIVRGDHLKKGSVVSCGCLNDEKRRTRFKDLTNYENDNFKVIERDVSRNQRVDWKCLCKHCGNTTILNSNEIDRIKSCGCLKKGASKEYMARITNLDAKKNDKPTAKSTTGVRGVYYSKRRHSYQAFINVDKKSIYLGSSKNFDEAVELRRNAEIQYGYRQITKEKEYAGK